MVKVKNPVLALLRQDFDPGDRWGSAWSALFSVADTIWHCADVSTPSHWAFRHASFCDGLDDYNASELRSMHRAGEITDGDLIHAGTVLDRLLTLYDREGSSY